MKFDVLYEYRFPTTALNGTLFGDYISAYEGKNETSAPFHFAELLTAASALVGRKIAIDVGYKLHPNFYSVLVGEPGVSRKTFSVRRVENLVFKSDAGISIETDIASAEGYIEAWAEDIADQGDDGRALLSLSELQRMLIVNHRKGTSNVLPFLTDVYDNPPEVSRKKAGKVRITIDEPSLTMIGGITPGLLDKYFTHDDFSSGFISRLNFYIAQPTPRQSMLQPPTTLQPILDRLAAKTTKQVYTFDDVTQQMYDAWYKGLNHLEEPNELIQQCSVRLEIQVPKLACILCWLRHGMNINKADWRAAVAIGKYWMDTSRMLFSDFAANDEVREQNLIIKALKKREGRATSSELYEALKRKMSSKRRNEILLSMTMEGTLYRDIIETAGRPKTIYQLPAES